MSLMKSFTQGGQTQLHNFRMIRQVLGVTFWISIVIAFLVSGYFIYTDFRGEEVVLVLMRQWSKIRLLCDFLPSNFLETVTISLNGKLLSYRCAELLYHQPLCIFVHKMEILMLKRLGYGLKAGIGIFLLISVFWIWRGKITEKKEILSGTEDVSAKELKKLIKENGDESDFSLGGIPLLKNKELQHLLIAGTTGSGKTNCFHELLLQIRKKKQRAVVIDATGVFVEKYYREGHDKILNPLDKRSEQWNIWAECKMRYQYDELAASLIPQHSKDPFWSSSGQIIFSVCAQKLAAENNKSIRELIELVTIRNLADIQDFFSGTKAAPLLDLRSKETVASIRATMSTSLKSIDLLQETDNPFSISDWIKDEEDLKHSDEWLFISCPPEMRETLRPLLSTWTSVACKALMSLTPCAKRRLWFIVDELPALNKLPDLHTGLAEYRKYGGCFAIGTQDLSLLDEIYGYNLVKSIANLCSTKILFRISGSDIAERMSKWLGTQEYSESVENISYGAHQMRDGVSLNDVRREKLVINPDEIMKLPDLQGYIKLPGNYPIARVKFKYHDLPSIAPSIIRYTEEDVAA